MKEDKLQIALIITIIIAILEVLIICLGVSIINDLKATANGYKSDRDICRRESEMSE